jgi:hypothetical protein
MNNTIPAELTESLREALAQALASGALDGTRAGELATTFLTTGSLDRPVDTMFFQDEPNKTAYWAIWCLSWWIDGNALYVGEQTIELRRSTPHPRTHETNPS